MTLRGAKLKQAHRLKQGLQDRPSWTLHNGELGNKQHWMAVKGTVDTGELPDIFMQPITRYKAKSKQKQHTLQRANWQERDEIPHS